MRNLDTEIKILEGKKQDFLEGLKSERRLQASSLRIYDSELTQLIKLLEKSDPKGLQIYLRKYSPTTALRKLVIWRAFLRNCPEPWTKMADQIASPKVREKQPRFLTEDECFRLEQATYRSKNGARDRLLLALGLQLGLRITEILQLRLSDFEKEWLRVTRKGGKEQRLPLTASLQAQIHFWKKERSLSANDFVFLGNAGKPMSVRNAQKLLVRLAKSANLREKIHPHALRHTFATMMAANGVPLVALKEFLGHRRLNTTERYLHVTPQHLKESLKYLKPQ